LSTFEIAEKAPIDSARLRTGRRSKWRLQRAESF